MAVTTVILQLLASVGINPVFNSTILIVCFEAICLYIVRTDLPKNVPVSENSLLE
jgi:hypothetical protein